MGLAKAEEREQTIQMVWDAWCMVLGIVWRENTR